MNLDLSSNLLESFNLSADHIDALSADHAELVKHYLHDGRPAGSATRPGAASRVKGVGITEQVPKGRDTGGVALLMLVDKLPKGAPTRSSRGFPILYEEVGVIRPTAGFLQKYRPVLCGVSIAPRGTSYSGTLGCIVQSGGRQYILATSHLLSNMNSLPIGTSITQQAAQDGGSDSSDAIASLSYHTRPGQSPVDAGLAMINAGVQVDPRMARENNTVEKLVAPVARPSLDMAVQKSGRTTGHTRGKIAAVGVTIRVEYPSIGPVTLQNAFTVKASPGQFGTAGDSGALVTTAPSNQPVGLLFASSGGGGMSTAYASPLADVLSALQALTGQPVQVVY